LFEDVPYDPRPPPPLSDEDDKKPHKGRVNANGRVGAMRRRREQSTDATPDPTVLPVDGVYMVSADNLENDPFKPTDEIRVSIA
jgi:hypothetical protein